MCRKDIIYNWNRPGAVLSGTKNIPTTAFLQRIEKPLFFFRVTTRGLALQRVTDLFRRVIPAFL